MEWLILLVLVPGILVPIVLLYGFAGCSFNPQRAALPLAPTVTPTPKSIDHISVTWVNNDPAEVDHYRFVRKFLDVIQRDEPNLAASVTSIEDTGLAESTEYTYEVSTTTVAGTSDPPGTAKASTFALAFAVNPATTPIDETIPLGNFCFVQRIPAGLLLASGTKQVEITVRGAPTGNLTINSIYISRAAGTGNLWDSAADLTQVTPSPTLAATPTEVGPVDYVLDQTQDLIVAFDLTATAGAATVHFVAEPGVTLYFKAGVQQASVPIRDPDYITQPDPRLYFVVTIGVQ